jgi:hypothetical protein
MIRAPIAGEYYAVIDQGSWNGQIVRAEYDNWSSHINFNLLGYDGYFHFNRSQLRRATDKELGAWIRRNSLYVEIP